jgi:RHS repeat-associated protein
VLEYDYDSYGNVISITGLLKNAIGKVNPFLYKVYCYDHETGLYYNVTRYYNPQWGRFLNADDVSYLDPSSVNGLNLFAYCNNNPVMNFDPNGNALITLMLICAGASLLSTYAADVIDNIKNRDKGLRVLIPKRTLGEYVGNTVSGFIAPIVPFGSTSAGKFIEVGTNELFNIREYSKEEKNRIYKEAFATDVIKSTLTFGLGQVLGTDPLTGKIYNPVAKTMSSIFVDIIDHFDILFGERRERINYE